VVETKECSKGATNTFAYASIERCIFCTKGGGGVNKPRLFYWPSCFGIDSASYMCTLHVSCTVQVQAKLSWVNCRIHTQLKHALHLFKARFSGKAGSCFLKVRAASLIRPRKVTQTCTKKHG